MAEPDSGIPEGAVVGLLLTVTGGQPVLSDAVTAKITKGQTTTITLSLKAPEGYM